jgi:hypothetical protein
MQKTKQGTGPALKFFSFLTGLPPDILFFGVAAIDRAAGFFLPQTWTTPAGGHQMSRLLAA